MSSEIIIGIPSVYTICCLIEPSVGILFSSADKLIGLLLSQLLAFVATQCNT